MIKRYGSVALDISKVLIVTAGDEKSAVVMSSESGECDCVIEISQHSANLLLDAIEERDREAVASKE